MKNLMLLAVLVTLAFGLSYNFFDVYAQEIKETLLLTIGDESLQEPFVSRLDNWLSNIFKTKVTRLHINGNSQMLDLQFLNRFTYVFVYNLDFDNPPSQQELKIINRWFNEPDKKLIWAGYHGDKFNFSQCGFEVFNEPIDNHQLKMIYVGKELLQVRLENSDLMPAQIISDAAGIEAFVESLDGNGILPIIVSGCDKRALYIGFHFTAHLIKDGGHLLVLDILQEYYELRYQAPNDKTALIRLEDVGASVDFLKLEEAVTYLRSQQIPYIMSVIPWTVINGLLISKLSEDKNFQSKLSWLLSPSGGMVIHGLSHQRFGNTGDDWEFGSPEGWALSVQESEQRVILAMNEVNKSGFSLFTIGWETPHYFASEDVYEQVFEKRFEFIFETPVCDDSANLLPYIMRCRNNIYLGTYLNYVSAPWEQSVKEILESAEFLSKLRHAVVAVFFFHGQLFGDGPLKEIIPAMKKQGWKFPGIISLIGRPKIIWP